MCAFFAIVSCLTVTVPQTEHFLPSVRPVAVQVAALPLTVTIVCAFFAIVVCLTVTSPQTEHFLPSVRPVFVQVAATALRVVSS